MGPGTARPHSSGLGQRPRLRPDLGIARAAGMVGQAVSLCEVLAAPVESAWRREQSARGVLESRLQLKAQRRMPSILPTPAMSSLSFWRVCSPLAWVALLGSYACGSAQGEDLSAEQAHSAATADKSVERPSEHRDTASAAPQAQQGSAGTPAVAAPRRVAYTPDCAPPAGTFTDASCWRADYKPFSAWINLAPWAFWSVEAAEPNILVELGSHNGYSTFVFAQAIKALGLATHAYAVDTWEGDVHAGFYNNETFDGVEARTRAHYADNLHLLRMTFDAALAHFEDGSVDILHIDGQHHYEDVKHDFDTWLPKMSRRGVVLFHDIEVYDRNFGVHKFWAEVSRRYPSFAFRQLWGLGILGVGDDLPPAFASLFAASQTPAGECVRKIYAALGDAAESWQPPAQ